jgi:hypothetical protein
MGQSVCRALTADLGPPKGYLRAARSKPISEAPFPSTVLTRISGRFVFSDLYRDARAAEKQIILDPFGSHDQSLVEAGNRSARLQRKQVSSSYPPRYPRVIRSHHKAL